MFSDSQQWWLWITSRIGGYQAWLARFNCLGQNSWCFFWAGVQFSSRQPLGNPPMLETPSWHQRTHRNVLPTFEWKWRWNYAEDVQVHTRQLHLWLGENLKFCSSSNNKCQNICTNYCLFMGPFEGCPTDWATAAVKNSFYAIAIVDITKK